MLELAYSGYITATDLADYLVKNNLTQSSGEDWVANINKDLQAQQPNILQ